MKYFLKRDLIIDSSEKFDISALLISAFMIFLPAMLFIVLISIIMLFIL